MKKILVVGYCGYDYLNKLAAKYPDTLFFTQYSVKNSTKPQGVVELAKMIDGILFTKSATSDDRLAFEVAIAMMNKTETYEESDFPLEEEKESEDENG